METNLTFKQIVETIKLSYLSRVPVFVGGPPAIGKSAAFRIAAQELGVELIDFRLTTKEPIDLRGMPDISGEFTEYKTPIEYPRDPNSRGIFLLDELGSVNPSIQVAALQMIQDRKIGSYSFPPGWMIMGAGNRVCDRAGATRLISPLSSRMCMIEMRPDPDQWVSWFFGQCDEHGYSDVPGMYINFRPESLYSFDPKSASNSFPSPRTWEYAAKLIKAGIPKDIRLPILSGVLGLAVAADYIAFEKVYESIPSIQGILMNPDASLVPTEPSTVAATVSALAKRMVPANIGAVLKYLNRCPKEMEFLGMKLGVRFSPECQNTRDFAKWFAANQSFLLPT